MPAMRASDSLLLAGLALLFAAGVSAELAFAHMRETAALVVEVRQLSAEC